MGVGWGDFVTERQGKAKVERPEGETVASQHVMGTTGQGLSSDADVRDC